MDDLLNSGSSHDLSEASSVVSFDSQETDFTDHTDVISNVSKKLDYSPTEVRAFPHHGNEMIPHVEDPLPVVREDKVLTEESLLEADSADIAESLAHYEQEEHDFNKEMNTTKIAFAAYRNAVLHLVHHQNHGKGNGGEVNKEEKGQDGREISEDNANQRMKLLEEDAKFLVETKAKACFEAVDVANEFMEMREARDGAKNSLFQELLKSNDTRNVVKSSLAEQNKKNAPNTGEDAIVKNNVAVPEVKKEASTSSTSIKPKSKIVAKPTQKPAPSTIKETKKKVNKSDTNDTQRTAYVRLRKSTKHPDCILHTFPNFQFIPETKEEVKNEDDETPATYGTTKWIGGMISWRIQRKAYQTNAYKKCGCPDCQKQLQSLASPTSS